MDSETILSGIAILVSILSFLLVVFRTQKDWYVNLVVKERITWKENVKQALDVYIDAYYTQQDLRPYEKKILLFLNSENTNANQYHVEFAMSLKAVTNHEIDTLDNLIKTSQVLFNKNWRDIKLESSTIFRSKNVIKK